MLGLASKKLGSGNLPTSVIKLSLKQKSIASVSDVLYKISHGLIYADILFVIFFSGWRPVVAKDLSSCFNFSKILVRLV
jgi:hypothetical protein